MFGRVFGKLAVTRSFGDFEYKDLEVTSEVDGSTSIKSFVLHEPEIREL